MRIRRTATRTVRLASAALVAILGLAVAQPAFATNNPPRADAGLVGTWTNETVSNDILLKRLVITVNASGAITVDTFGKCGQPTLCEYGRVPAVVFGPLADSKTGRFFESNQAFTLYNKVLLGQLVDTASGPRIRLDRFVVFKDGTRYNSGVSYVFRRVTTSTAGTTKSAPQATGYPAGLQPVPAASLLGTWHNTNPNTIGIAELIVTHGTGNSLLVHAFGRCTPTLCDIGTFGAVTYGADSTTAHGARFLAPNNAGFKNELYTGLAIAGGQLRVNYYGEYTDSSGRSNYAISETFAH